MIIIMIIMIIIEHRHLNFITLSTLFRNTLEEEN